MAGVLSAFLRSKKAAYLDAVKTGNGNEWTVVMGNEAGGMWWLARGVVVVYGYETDVPAT